MKGTRPLSTDEIIAVSQQFDGMYEIRNRSLFMIGVSVGGRISELLALKIGDVYQNGQAVSDLLFQKNVVKGKETARMIPINQDGRQAILELIDWHTEQYGDLDPKRLLFQSRQGGSISRSQAHRILEAAFRKAGLNYPKVRTVQYFTPCLYPNIYGHLRLLLDKVLALFKFELHPKKWHTILSVSLVEITLLFEQIRTVYFF